MKRRWVDEKEEVDECTVAHHLRLEAEEDGEGSKREREEGRGEAILVELDRIQGWEGGVEGYVSILDEECKLLDLGESEVRVEMALEGGILEERREGGREG